MARRNCDRRRVGATRAACDAAGLRPGSFVPQIDSLQVARLAGLTIATSLPPEPLLPLYVAGLRGRQEQ